MKTLDQWLDAYGQSHRNPMNKRIHWVCIPLIMISLLGLLWSLPAPVQGLWAMLLMAFALVFYLRLSKAHATGMAVCTAGFLGAVYGLSLLFPGRLWMVCLLIFILAWVGQFIGHKIEGKKPSFFDDLQFLLIGPLWLLDDLIKTRKP